MTRYAANPPWATRILNKHWGAIERRIGAKHMPATITGKPQGSKRVIQGELGCGSWGCVYSTSDPTVVFKLTTDASEAAFAVAAMSLPTKDWPRGMTRYHNVFEFSGEAHQGNRVFGLTRSAVDVVGKDLCESCPGKWLDHIREFGAFAGLFMDVFHSVRDNSSTEDLSWKLFLRDLAEYREPEDEPDRGGDDYDTFEAFRGLLGCKWEAEALAGEDHGFNIGEALLYYMGQGMLLVDVHANNVGMDRHGVVVIFDPGHMVPLDPKWLSVQVPQL